MNALAQGCGVLQEPPALERESAALEARAVPDLGLDVHLPPVLLVHRRGADLRLAGAFVGVAGALQLLGGAVEPVDGGLVADVAGRLVGTEESAEGGRLPLGGAGLVRRAALQEGQFRGAFCRYLGDAVVRERRRTVITPPTARAAPAAMAPGTIQEGPCSMGAPAIVTCCLGICLPWWLTTVSV